MTKLDRKYLIYLFAFLLVCVLDPVAFSLQLAGVPKAPFGLAGLLIIIGIAVGEVFLDKNYKISPEALVLLLGYLMLALLAVFSGNFDISDAWHWIKNGAYFYLGAAVCRLFLFREIGLYVKTLIALLIATSAAVWGTSAEKIYVTGEIENVNYLYVSDSIAVVGLIWLTFMRDARYRLPTMIFVATCLYFVGSRFGLIAFVLSSGAAILKDVSWKKRALISAGFCVGLMALFGYVESLGLDINDNRFVRLVMFTENDTSLNARIEDDEYAREVFLKNPIAGGGYKFYLAIGEGMYAHNALSVIYEFGLFGALFLLAVVLVLAISLVQSIHARTASAVIAFSVFLALAAFSKVYFWWVYYFGMGFLVVCAKSSRICHDVSKS